MLEKTRKEKSQIIFSKISHLINEKNIYINSLEDWIEQGKSLIDEEININIEEDIKEIFLTYIKTNFNINEEEYLKNLEEKQKELNELKKIINATPKWKKNIEKVIYVDKENINNNSSNLLKSLEQLEEIDKSSEDLKDYLYLTIVNKKLVEKLKKTKKNEITKSGSINAFLNKKTGMCFLDYYSLNEINDGQWTKDGVLKSDRKIDNEENINFEKYEVEKYIEEINDEVFLQEKVEKNLEIKLEEIMFSVPTNNIEMFHIMEKIDNDQLFSITKNPNEENELIEHYKLNQEIGEYKVIYKRKYNEKKEEEITNINFFIYLDNFKEEKLYESGFDGSLIYITNNSENYSNLEEIQELKKIKKEKRMVSLIPKKINPENEHIRIKFVLDEGTTEETKEYIEKNFHILNEEELLISKNLLSQFSTKKDISMENISKYSSYIKKNIPKKIIKKATQLNKEYLSSLNQKKEMKVETKENLSLN